MADDDGFPEKLDKALKQYFEDDGQTDVNKYLDEQHIEHPELSIVGEFHPEMPLCPTGYHWEQHTYYNKHNGQPTTIGGCVWNTGIHWPDQ